jgi:hypothetical protein
VNGHFAVPTGPASLVAATSHVLAAPRSLNVMCGFFIVGLRIVACARSVVNPPRQR